MIEDKANYCKLKAKIIKLAQSGVDVSGAIRALTINAPDFCDKDADIEWLRIYVKTKNFTKAIPIKKAEKLMAPALSMNTIGDSTFSKYCERTLSTYFAACRNKTKKRKRIKRGLAISFFLLIAFVVIGLYFGDKTGVLYGHKSISFIANGQEYSQNNAVKYNDYVQLSIPERKGYEATGIIDTNTQKQLFDATGKSISVVKNRDLSDYDNCNLEVTYEPRIYSARVMSSKNVSLASVSYTVEDKPEEVFGVPQHLDGYIFDGWYIDSQFNNKFSGDFKDYTDIDEPLVLYPHYSLGGWSINWDLQGGEMLAGEVNSYSILTDVALPKNDLVKRNGYILKGWAIEGKLVEYFPSTSMRDITLVAVWEPQVYTVSYQTNGGEIESVTDDFTIEDRLSLQLPIKAGYRFEGWYTSKVYQYQIEEIEIGTTGDLSVYAKWTPISYIIEYELDGGENSILNPSTYTVEQEVKLFEPKRKGYDFVGWYDSKGNEYVTKLSAINNGDVSLAAVWEAKEYTITVCPDNGNPTFTVDVTYDSNYCIAVPSVKGFPYSTKPFQMLILYLLLLQERITGTKNGLISP